MTKQDTVELDMGRLTGIMPDPQQRIDALDSYKMCVCEHACDKGTHGPELRWLDQLRCNCIAEKKMRKAGRSEQDTLTAIGEFD